VNEEDEEPNEMYCPFELPYDEYGDMMFEKRLALEGSSSPITSPHPESRRGSTVADTDGKRFPLLSRVRDFVITQFFGKNRAPRPRHQEAANPTAAPVKLDEKPGQLSYKWNLGQTAKGKRPKMTPSQLRSQLPMIRRTKLRVKARMRKRTNKVRMERRRVMVTRMIVKGRADHEILGHKLHDPSKRKKEAQQIRGRAGQLDDAEAETSSLRFPTFSLF